MPEKEQKSSSKNSYPLITKSGYPLDEVVSALQKEIRRGNEVEALYWATEMVESGFAKYLWRRLFTIVDEDISPEEYHIPPLVWSLYAMTAEEIANTPSRSWKSPEISILPRPYSYSLEPRKIESLIILLTIWYGKGKVDGNLKSRYTPWIVITVEAEKGLKKKG